MDKKPLYRKLNKVTHNGPPHHDFGFKQRYRDERNTKPYKDKTDGNPIVKSGRKNRNTDIGLYDYCPLYKFLLTMEGHDWDDVWHECQKRLNTTAPVLNMVVNINEKGMPTSRNDFGLRYMPQDWIDLNFRQIGDCYYPKYFSFGNFTYFSTMYVDENGLLQFVDKDFIPSPVYGKKTNWTETFNGIEIHKLLENE